MTLLEVQVKWSMDRFGPDNFSTLQIKGHVLHRARAHLKVLVWSLFWNALLSEKIPLFLSRLNEINASVGQAGHHRAQQVDRQSTNWSAVQTSQTDSNDHYCPSADCRLLCWARRWPAWTTVPLISFKRDKNIIRSAFQKWSNRNF